MREAHRHVQIVVDVTSAKGKNTVADRQRQGEGTIVFHPDGSTIRSIPVPVSIDVAGYAAYFDN